MPTLEYECEGCQKVNRYDVSKFHVDMCACDANYIDINKAKSKIEQEGWKYIAPGDYWLCDTCELNDEES